MIESIDQVLLDKIAQGDKKPFEEAYIQHYPEIRRFIYYRTGRNDHLADDLASSMFLHFFEYVARGNLVGHVRGFLYQSARNEIARFFRDHKRTIDISEVEYQLESQDTIVQREVEFIFEREQAMSAMERLDSEWRQIVSLRFIELLSYREIAELVGKSEGAVRVIVHRAVKELRKMVEG